MTVDLICIYMTIAEGFKSSDSFLGMNDAK